MKLCMSHYINKSIPDANFESGSSSTFADMMSQISLRRREKVIKFGYLPRENGFNFKNITFYVQNHSSRPKIDLHVNFINFQAEENYFYFQNFWDVLMRKEQQQPLD